MLLWLRLKTMNYVLISPTMDVWWQCCCCFAFRLMLIQTLWSANRHLWYLAAVVWLRFMALLSSTNLSRYAVAPPFWVLYSYLMIICCLHHHKCLLCHCLQTGLNCCVWGIIIYSLSHIFLSVCTAKCQPLLSHHLWIMCILSTQQCLISCFFGFKGESCSLKSQW